MHVAAVASFLAGKAREQGGGGWGGNGCKGGVTGEGSLACKMCRKEVGGYLVQRPGEWGWTCKHPHSPPPPVLLRHLTLSGEVKRLGGVGGEERD